MHLGDARYDNSEYENCGRRLFHIRVIPCAISVGRSGDGGVLSARSRPATRRTFSVSNERGGWQFRHGAVVVGDFHSRGDAVRAACVGARAAERRGHRARVVVAPEGEVMPHFEPHFGL